MKKVFGMIVLLLSLAACNNAELEMQSVDKTDGITITATLAPKTASTKAVADKGDNKITVSWAENEHLAILYQVSSTWYEADATIAAVDGTTGAATISFTVNGNTANNTPCTIVYPLSAANDEHNGVKDAAALLAAQDGTLNANLDVRVGEGTIQTGETPGLTVTTQPAAQYAIFKFTVKNADGSATISVKPLTVTIDSQDYVITPASATSELYAALPAVSDQTVSFTATGSSGKVYTASKAGITFAAGNYYQSVLKLAWQPATGHSLSVSIVGEVVGTDGLAYAVADKGNLPETVTAAGMVAYRVGASALVIALRDENGSVWWSNVGSAAAAHQPSVTGQTWKLPSEAEWKQMFAAFGGSEGSCAGLNTAITNAGGIALLNGGEYGTNYWSSTENGTQATYVNINNTQVKYYSGSKDFSRYIRACLVFGNPNLIPGVFSVSSGGQTVKFARGNLTYTSDHWSLVSNSWEYSNTVYGKGNGSHHFSWNDVFNSAYSGDSEIKDEVKTHLGSTSWRALSSSEWPYLLKTRTVTWHRYAKISGATTLGSRYLLIFPDAFAEADWTAAMGTKPSGDAFDGNGEQSIAYTVSNFAFMQAAGIVILPAAGEYYAPNGGQWRRVGDYGNYWSKTTADYGSGPNARYMYFTNDKVEGSSYQAKDGTFCYSVRLVQNQ